MPNKHTFGIKPITDLLTRYITFRGEWIDGFCNGTKWSDCGNDLNKEVEAAYHEEATDFFKRFPDSSIGGVLFDPPYSITQAQYTYKRYGDGLSSVNPHSMVYWKNIKDEVARIVQPDGLCISFGWNSMGMGKKRGFKQIEILLVPHGGTRNDTIVTVEQKIK